MTVAKAKYYMLKVNYPTLAERIDNEPLIEDEEKPEEEETEETREIRQSELLKMAAASAGDDVHLYKGKGGLMQPEARMLDLDPSSTKSIKEIIAKDKE